MAKNTYDQLKLYLMLARPEHMDAAWFSSALLRDWPKRDGVKDGVWQGMAPSLLSFYGAQLAPIRSGNCGQMKAWSARRARCWFA
jgi:type VI secretion system protein ImpL